MTLIFFFVSFVGNWSKNFFDATMTYRQDSNIFNALYEFVPKFKIPSKDFQGRWKKPHHRFETKIWPLVNPNKSRTAAWLASKCETAGRREEYIKELQKYIDIDVFGRCGKRPLPRSIEGLSGPDAIVLTYRNLLKPYYFYMSFEVIYYAS